MTVQADWSRKRVPLAAETVVTYDSAGTHYKGVGVSTVQTADLVCLVLRSFHIELICKDIFATWQLQNYPVGVATVLSKMGPYVGQLMMDPTYNSCRVDKPLSTEDRDKLIQRVNGDGGRAIEALQLEASGQHTAAIEKWKYIFLNGFPK